MFEATATLFASSTLLITTVERILQGQDHLLLVSSLIFPNLSAFVLNLTFALAISCALAVPLVANPVHSLLCLIICFFASASLLIANSAEFLGYLFLIVYIGAIAILFLFVIMLLNVNQLTTKIDIVSFLKQTHRLPAITISGAVGVYFLSNLLVALTSSTGQLGRKGPIGLIDLVQSTNGDIAAFAFNLYTEQSALLIVDSLILFSAMVGAIVLAANSTDFVPAAKQ